MGHKTIFTDGELVLLEEGEINCLLRTEKQFSIVVEISEARGLDPNVGLQSLVERMVAKGLVVQIPVVSFDMAMVNMF